MGKYCISLRLTHGSKIEKEKIPHKLASRKHSYAAEAALILPHGYLPESHFQKKNKHSKGLNPSLALAAVFNVTWIL